MATNQNANEDQSLAKVEEAKPGKDAAMAASGVVGEDLGKAQQSVSRRIGASAPRQPGVPYSPPPSIIPGSEKGMIQKVKSLASSTGQAAKEVVQPENLSGVAGKALVGYAVGKAVELGINEMTPLAVRRMVAINQKDREDRCIAGDARTCAENNGRAFLEFIPLGFVNPAVSAIDIKKAEQDIENLRIRAQVDDNAKRQLEALYSPPRPGEREAFATVAVLDKMVGGSVPEKTAPPPINKEYLREREAQRAAAEAGADATSTAPQRKMT